MAAVRRRLTPYLLLFPGAFWLIVFFVVPMYYMARLSLDSGSLQQGFQFTWQWSNYHDALSLYKDPFIRAFEYAGAATVIALLIGYPLAYAIAFKGGKWKNAMLFAVVAPFFTRGHEGFNIDDEDDWDRARALIESGVVTLPDVERSRPYSPAE